MHGRSQLTVCRHPIDRSSPSRSSPHAPTLPVANLFFSRCDPSGRWRGCHTHRAWQVSWQYSLEVTVHCRGAFAAPFGVAARSALRPSRSLGCGPCRTNPLYDESATMTPNDFERYLQMVSMRCTHVAPCLPCTEPRTNCYAQPTLPPFHSVLPLPRLTHRRKCMLRPVTLASPTC